MKRPEVTILGYRRRSTPTNVGQNHAEILGNRHDPLRGRVAMVDRRVGSKRTSSAALGGGEAQMAARTKTVSGRGVDIAVEEIGSIAQPTLVFVHGLAGGGSEWRPVADLLQDSYRCLLVDLRGHGTSTRLPDDMSIEAMADDIGDVVAELSERAATCLVGQSIGGVVAMAAASQNPTQARHLVVVEATPVGPQPALPSQISDWLSSWPKPFASPQDVERFFGSSEATGWTGSLEHRDDGLWPRFDDTMIVRAAESLAEHSRWHDWQAIQCPTLIVRGEHGWVPDDAATEMAQSNELASVHTIPSTSHNAHMQAPAALASLIRSFLEGDFAVRAP